MCDTMLSVMFCQHLYSQLDLAQAWSTHSGLAFAAGTHAKAYWIHLPSRIPVVLVVWFFVLLVPFFSAQQVRCSVSTNQLLLLLHAVYKHQRVQLVSLLGSTCQHFTILQPLQRPVIKNKLEWAQLHAMD